MSPVARLISRLAFSKDFVVILRSSVAFRLNFNRFAIAHYNEQVKDKADIYYRWLDLPTGILD